jgi:DHA1 family bicyclomycin/chloramphenicol resistance-like MFS transporter
MNPTKQKHLGANGLVVLIALLSAFVPLSTDLYLPALPGMSEYFQAPVEQINLTLTGFFVFYAFGTLIWGPLSDHYGRKPVLLVGLTIYAASSAFCALTWNVTSLILFRMLQAAGGSAAGAVATAVVKDVYSGRKRESVLAIVQSMVLITPAVAPILGAFLLNIMSWRGVFWTLAGIGILALIGSLLLEETITLRSSGSILGNLGRLGKVLQNRGFTMLLFLFSIGGISGMAFIAGSTYIYQNGFGLSEQAYSYFFSLNALGMISGPMIFLFIARRYRYETIIRTCFLIMAASGLLVFFFGSTQPWIFALCILPASIAGSCSRPPASNLMLEQQTGDTGSVASVMGCTGLLMGSLGMQLISFDWGSKILALGVMSFTTATISLLCWPVVLRHIKRIPGGKTGYPEQSETTQA